MVGTGDLEIRVAVFPLPFNGKDDVIGVHVARGLEVFIAVPLDAFAQKEGVLLTVWRNSPAFSQPWHHTGATSFKIYQTTVYLAVGVK